MMGKQINYFGYGANKTKDMIKSMIGRVPESNPAVLENFELCIQDFDEIKSPKVKKILKKVGWNSRFKTYCIRRAKGKKVYGTLWKTTKKEHELIDNWEIHKIWYTCTKIIVKSKGKNFHALTEIIDDKKLKPSRFGKRYPAFLNNKARMLRIARQLR